MLDLLLLAALAIFIYSIFRWLGPPSRRGARPAPNPEAELPPPDTPVIIAPGPSDTAT